MPANETRPVDIRCPYHQRRLLLKIGRPVIIDGANLIEVACRDCRNDRRAAGEDVTLVVHHYNVLGQIVDTTIT